MRPASSSTIADAAGTSDSPSARWVVEEVAAAHYAATDEPIRTAVAQTSSRPRRAPRLLKDRAGVSLESTGRTPELFARARKRLPLNRWDEAQLERYAGDAAALEPLRAAIAAPGAKVEQETIQRRLYALLDADV